MDTVFARVAGLDVHQKSIQCAVRCRQEFGKLLSQVKSFKTMTRDLEALASYLQSFDVTHVALESTGVLWKPVWNLFEGRFTLLLVNPHHVKKVPGRKSDVSDAEWIAQLLQCGLLHGSFVPPRALRELRDLTWQRVQLTAEHTRAANRIHKLLEDANVKLGAVASDILGKSVNAAGCLWERCDHDFFVGDILDRIKHRITTAYVVIADMTNANPNVYLEVGYALGKNIPTLLLAREGEELKFDVKTQKCVYYKNISHLRKQLIQCLATLLAEKA